MVDISLNCMYGMHIRKIIESTGNLRLAEHPIRGHKSRTGRTRASFPSFAFVFSFDVLSAWLTETAFGKSAMG